MPDMLLRHATLASLDPPSVAEADLRLAGDRIMERGSGLAAMPDEEVVDLGGGLVLPGLVNAHTHLYSSLARGMPAPEVPPRGFVEVLEKVWWRLDRSLDEASVHSSALVGACEAALSGTTFLVDHHASPGFVTGSLATVRRAVEQVGLRSVLCYETTDRHGPEQAREGVAENVAFQEVQQSPLTRGMVGAHASFTLEDDTLGALAQAVQRTRSSLHVHVAEDRADLDDCRRRHGCGLVERYARAGLLGDRTLFAHAVHLQPEEIEEVHRAGGFVAHNPRSNMNNQVGYAPTAAFRRSALGTDGMDQDMLAEARAAYLKLREAGRDDALPAALQMLVGGHRLAAALFGLPFGKLDAGGPADLLLLDYRPPTPLHSGNLGAHLLFGIDRSHLCSVIVAGRFVVRDRRLAVDADEVYGRAREEAARLWERMSRLG
jgi:putative selenium metabolism protein SsnA